MDASINSKDRINAVSDALFFSIGEGAIVVDERGHIARTNAVALDILGFKKKDLIGKWYPDTIIAEDENGNSIPTIERPIMEAFLSGQPVFKRIYYRKKDNTRIAVALTVSPVIIDGEPVGAIELFRDITAELELDQAKDEFISIASHQLRTPATIVKQYLGLILEGYAETEELKNEMIRIAYDNNERQLVIVNDLLKVAQAEASTNNGQQAEINLVTLLKGVIKDQKTNFDQRAIGLTLETLADELLCVADPLHMQMVFENILDNANKYSPENSNVLVKAQKTKGNISVEIIDEGIGIASQEIPKLFTKFSRAKNASSKVEGTGLGLYWAKKLIDLYKGEIKITSRLGKGTHVTVKVPSKKPAIPK